MKTLILGCGYLGRRVGRLLLERGERVFGTVRSKISAHGLESWGIEPILADVLDPGSLSKLPDADRMLYCVGFDRSAGIPMRTVSVDGLRNVLAHLPEGCQRIVYAGSTSVYGQTDGDWIDETSLTRPSNESGRVSLDAERILWKEAMEHGLQAVVVRFVGLYGPGRILRRATLERSEPIAGDPSRFLNLIHIDDAAASAVAALDRGEEDRVYLACDDRPIERQEFYSLVAERIGAPAPRFEPPAPGSPEAARDGANRRASNRRMKAELGVALRYPDIKVGVPAALASEATESKKTEI
ncbi:SDR family oxidoreductase [soil metagenome]